MNVEDRYKVAVLVVISLLAVSMLAVAGVVYLKYSKVAEYACYYGLPEGYANSNTATGLRPAGMQGSGNSIVNLLDLRCIRMPSEGFSCQDVHPVGVNYTSQEYRGSFFATQKDLSSFFVT